MSLETHAGGDDPEAALRAARLRFVAQFPVQCDEFSSLMHSLESAGASGDRAALIRLVHRMAGLAGMVGFPTVGGCARDLENYLEQVDPATLDADWTRRAVTGLREAFGQELAQPAPAWVSEPHAPATGARILLVEDDPDQRALVAAILRQAGHTPVEIDRGDGVVAAARAEHPTLVLLDIDLPGASGLDACRALRTDADLHDTPIIFLTGRSSHADRVAGLAVGGDDYLVKPVDPTELRLRIDRVLERRAAPRPAASEDVLSYAAFLTAAREALERGRVALALVRIPREHAETAIAGVAREARRRDLIGRYDDGHVMALLPDVTAADAVQRLTALAATLAAAGVTVYVGIAPGDGRTELRTLIERADEALAEARYRHQPVALHGEAPSGPSAAPTTIVVTEDDPDVMRILDSRLQAAGYRTVLAFDGQQALDAIAAHAPDMVLLDLMLPRLTGFEVLAELQRGSARRPKVVVVSARGREADVTRAFQLGADDYVTKPFGPEELLARLKRLLR